MVRPRPTQPEIKPATAIAPFSAGVPGGPVPDGWGPAAAPRFRKLTRYELVDDAGTTVVRASADNSSSGLAYAVNIDPRALSVVRWRWKVPQLIPDADNTQRERDDAPARIELTFSGDVSALPFGERLFFAQVKATAGIDIPYATLEYVWGNGAPAGTVIVNTWTSRIRVLLVRSGSRQAGQWVSEQRNVYEDFKQVFGEEPGKITHVGIYTDADATGERGGGVLRGHRVRPQNQMSAGGASSLIGRMDGNIPWQIP